MIDIHSHILFGVDDGAGNAEDSLIMAETAAENGVEQMIMTPHCCEADGFANFNTAELLTRFDSMRAMMKENEITLKLYNGIFNAKAGRADRRREAFDTCRVEIPSDRVRVRRDGRIYGTEPANGV